jgi:hypothetical protein
MANFCSECGKALAQGANFCTSCGASITGKPPAKAQWQDKREKVLGKQQNGGTNRTKLFLWIAGIAIMGGWFYANLPEGGNPVIKASPVVTNAMYYSSTPLQMTPVLAKVENGKIIIPVDLLKDKKFIRFTYGDPSYGTPLLAYISGEGKIVTAVSVCEPCNSTAFHINGDLIVCNSCGSTWELNDLEAVSGSCGRYPPDAVPNAVVGNEIQIDEQIVARWQRRI